MNPPQHALQKWKLKPLLHTILFSMGGQMGAAFLNANRDLSTILFIR